MDDVLNGASRVMLSHSHGTELGQRRRRLASKQKAACVTTDTAPFRGQRLAAGRSQRRVTTGTDHRQSGVTGVNATFQPAAGA